MAFSYNTAAILNNNFEKDILYNLKPKYANVRNIDLDEFSIYNATFLDDGKYYQPIRINNVSEKEEIIKIAENELFFGDEENKALQKIIDNNSIAPKSNFFDYYD